MVKGFFKVRIFKFKYINRRDVGLISAQPFIHSLSMYAVSMYAVLCFATRKQQRKRKSHFCCTVFFLFHYFLLTMNCMHIVE